MITIVHILVETTITKTYYELLSLLLFILVALQWWRHQMETFSALLAFCQGNSPVTCKFPSQMPVTQKFDVFFDLRLNKRLSKQSRRRWFETPSRLLWRHCNAILTPAPQPPLIPRLSQLSFKRLLSSARLWYVQWCIKGGYRSQLIWKNTKQ